MGRRSQAYRQRARDDRGGALREHSAAATVAGRSALLSSRMMPSMTGRHPPQVAPAEHARATRRGLWAPARTALRTSRSVTTWQ
jgi:hypothetical protein